MKDTFWTPELLAEFFNTHPDLPPTLMNEINLFKYSKAPKKEWEIVAYGEKHGNDIHVYRLQESGRYKSESHPDSSLTWPGHSFNGNHEFIHSVRRLSDRQIFVKNEVIDTPHDGKHIIEAFEISGNDMTVKLREGGHMLFIAIKKLPAPVLTTVDGKELFHGNKYFQLREDGLILELEVHGWANYENKTGIFSTREAAENYILNKRPLLSLNDVKDVLKNDFQVHSVWLLNELTALVKQKLNP